MPKKLTKSERREINADPVVRHNIQSRWHADSQSHVSRCEVNGLSAALMLASKHRHFAPPGTRLEEVRILLKSESPVLRERADGTVRARTRPTPRYKVLLRFREHHEEGERT